jgi:hypothetical protein
MGMEIGSRAGHKILGEMKGTVYLSAVVGALMGLLSLAGLILPGTLYPDSGLREAFLPNDLVNLVLGLPLFVYIFHRIYRGKLLGRLLLPGILVFVIYNYLAYSLGRPLDWISGLNILLVALSTYTLVRLLLEMDHTRIKDQLEGRIPAKFSGWVLIVFGGAFLALAVSQIYSGIQQGTIPPLGENAVAVADILVSLGWIGGGTLLLWKRPLGYSSGLGLLVAASFLFLGLILFFFLAPLLVARPFDWVEVITVLVMGLVAFIPTALYWRGIASSPAPGT